MLLSASTNPPKTVDELFEYVKKIDKTDIDYIHCDVMDGCFVEAKTFDYKTVLQISKITKKPLDVHLMIKSPGCKIKKYAKAGANIITIHYETYKNKNSLIKDLQKIRKFGCFAGLSFKPSTSVLDILPYIYYCDMLLIMSVVPGKSGQEFMPETYARIGTINKFLKEQKLEVVLEIDGGVNNLNLDKLASLNINSVVMGSYLYKSKSLKKIAELVHKA